ncbi:MAG: protein kinase, partial [Armatimonadetes bacterium]|nr:protein kinase [Armatimonadota bacterium]
MNCQRAGCGGTIVDGYCDTCGRAPVGATPSAVMTASAKVGASARASASLSGRGSFGTTGSGRGSAGSRRGSRGTTRRSLGAGLINLEPLPTIDPLQSLLSDPVVPEGKRFCPNCNAKLNLVKGFCPMCGTEYSFVPTLNPGDMVAGQYEVKGAIAFGGLGWIYLGWDTVLSRWVVMKGLLNSKDTVGAQAAVAERQFLAAVKHPNIVGVYNFVTQGTDGYIVMEYVGGKTLKTIRKERGVLPVAEAIAYTHRILLAFGYMERMGLVYCDFKPDNFMVEDDDVKLIDMGGVRRVDDMDGDIYGTKGYSAPEAKDDPSFTGDLYTVARTLAVLVADFAFQGSRYEFALPTPKEEP